MRRILTFDVDASPYEVAQEAVPSLKNVPGVKSVEVLSSASGGHPGFCILLETEDDLDAQVAAHVDRNMKNYADYLSNVTHRAYKKIG